MISILLVGLGWRLWTVSAPVDFRLIAAVGLVTTFVVLVALSHLSRRFVRCRNCGHRSLEPGSFGERLPGAGFGRFDRCRSCGARWFRYPAKRIWTDASGAEYDRFFIGKK